MNVVDACSLADQQKPASISSTFSLDPKIWSRSPDDILFLIIPYLDIRSQKQWAQVSQTFYSYACSRIWRDVRVEVSHFDTYVLLHEKKEPSTANTSQGIVHFLINNPFRPNTNLVFGGFRGPGEAQDVMLMQHVQKSIRLPLLEMPLPGSHVRILRIDTSDSVCLKSSLDSVLPVLLQCLPRLYKIFYDGPLAQSTLAAFLHSRSLKTLIIRRALCFKKPTGDLNSGVASGTDSSLDFRVLRSGQQNLNCLTIGRLKQNEAKALAEIIPSMRLIGLSLDCYGLIRDRGDHINFECSDSVSPLLSFIQHLSTTGGFPSGLIRLRLSDIFHKKIFPLFQLIAKMIQPCSSLEILGVTVTYNIKVLAKFGLRPCSTRVEVCSWETLARDELLDLVVHYRSPSGEIRVTGGLSERAKSPIANLARTMDDMAVAQAWESSKMIASSFTFRRNTYLPRDVISLGPCAEKECWCRDTESSDQEVIQLSNAFQTLKIQ